MSVKPDFESYTAHGVVVGPTELVVEQSVRLEMIKLLLPQNPNAPLISVLKIANLYTNLVS